jgi:protein O-GlcNAc transferase
VSIEGNVVNEQTAESLSSAAKVARAFASLREGRAAEAEALCVDVIRREPTHAAALHLLGVASLQRGDAASGIEFLCASLRANPNDAAAHCNLGNALRDVKRFEAAVESYRQALRIAPQFAGAYYGQGNALVDLNRYAEALRSFDAAIALRAEYPEAHNNRGNALLALGDPARAVESYRRAITQRPTFALAIGNLAQALVALKNFDEALGHYDRLLALNATDAHARRDRGHCLMQLGRVEAALASYDQALVLEPNDPEAAHGRGMARRRLGRHELALEDFERAYRLAPQSSEYLYRVAEALRDLARYGRAADAFAQVLEMTPDREFALGNFVHARLQVCDWSGYEQHVERALSAVAAEKRVYFPGPFLSVADSAEAQWRCARAFAGRPTAGGVQALWSGELYRREKIRVAYVSADFREHPVSALLVGVLEKHDRARFEVHGISLAREQRTSLGQRVKSAFDRFTDVSAHSDREVALLLREREIHIAVDLMGLSGHGRPGIFAHRPAPVQLSYLGYCATTASPDLDYLIADPVVVPPDERRFFTERIVYLPECYQPSDDRRPICAIEPLRSECGLPAQGFVFCCFNTHYKISPQFFGIWMRLLRETPDSVLWLSAGSPDVTANLRRAARVEGVDPERLVFAPRVEEAERHLARYRLADLFLDTLPFNAHATASDALWAGVPVLTCRGGSFAGRVASSLLTAIGMPELIATSVGEYYARALELATTPRLLSELRARLWVNRLARPLFATDRYTKHLESAFSAMLDRRWRGEGPLGFSVLPDSPV